MQTFLPYRNYVKSAISLDPLRLNKQSVETYQIMLVLTGNIRGWQHHPAVNMWRGYEASLMEYQEAVSDECMRREIKNTCLDKTNAVYRAKFGYGRRVTDPAWLGFEPFHLSHRSRLIQKFPEYYRPLFPGTPEDLEYRWPTDPDFRNP